MLNSLKSPLLLSAMLSATLGLTACSSPSSESTDSTATDSAATDTAADKLDTKFLTIATGGASGPYNIIGTSLSEVYVKTFGVNSKTQTTGASVENVNLLTQGKVDMVLALSDVVTDAVEGKNNFDKPITNIQQIAVLYPNVVQIVTTKKLAATFPPTKLIPTFFFAVVVSIDRWHICIIVLLLNGQLDDLKGPNCVFPPIFPE